MVESSCIVIMVEYNYVGRVELSQVESSWVEL